MGILRMVLAFLRAFFTSRAALAAENVMSGNNCSSRSGQSNAPISAGEIESSCPGSPACGRAGEAPCAEARNAEVLTGSQDKSRLAIGLRKHQGTTGIVPRGAIFPRIDFSGMTAYLSQIAE